MDNRSFQPDITDPHEVTMNGVNEMANGFYPEKRKKYDDEAKVISVLGSGDYGRAMAGRLVQCGYVVQIGSRDPNRASIKQMVRNVGAEMTTQEDAVSQSSMVIIAVGRDHYDALPIADLSGKILIDVSNNTERRRGPHYRSNAEYLQGLVPNSSVVKGFNVLSAYALENGGIQGSKEVFIAGDDTDAKARVSQLVRDLNFTPIDWGSIRAARDIEDVPLLLMPSWKKPVAIVFIILLIQYLLAIYKFQICWNWMGGGAWDWGWKHLSMQNVNRSFAIVALWVLAFCYLPGIIAAYVQLWRGTKYRRFPNWLDEWLRMRKQLGLLMLALAGMHCCMSLAIWSPQYEHFLYDKPMEIVATVKVNETFDQEETIKIYNQIMSWRGELVLVTATMSMFLLAVLGISSLPSVTATLSWREFTFIQSRLGWLAMILACLHDIFLGWDFMLKHYGCYLPTGLQYALYPPLLCILFKIPLLLPTVDSQLTKIRRGYERGAARSSVA